MNTYFSNNRMKSIFKVSANAIGHFSASSSDCKCYFSFKLRLFLTWILITLSFTSPHGKKSDGVKPVDLAGHSLRPYLRFPIFGNMTIKREQTLCVV